MRVTAEFLAKITAFIDCDRWTVRSRLHYAKQLLQSELQPYIRR